MEDLNIIIRKVKEGDDDSFEYLLAKHHNLIYKLINHLDRDVGDYCIDNSDLFQEASLALYESAIMFEIERDVKFSTFAFTYIKNRLLSYVKNFRKRCKEEIYSYDREDNFLKFEVRDYTVEAFREKEFKKELRTFIENLDEEDRKIVYMKSNECTYKEMAERLNTSTKRIDNKLRKLKKRLLKSEVIEYLTD